MLLYQSRCGQSSDVISMNTLRPGRHPPPTVHPNNMFTNLVLQFDGVFHISIQFILDASSIAYSQPMTRRSDMQWSWCGYNDRITHQHVPVGRVTLDDDQYDVGLG